MRRLILMLGCAVCAGCSTRTADSAVMSDDMFVATIADLREADGNSGGNVGTYMAAREQVLRKHGVTEQALRDYIAAYGADLQHLADVWARAHEAAGGSDAR